MSVYIERNKNNELRSEMVNPHYTDRRFRNPQTVFLAPGYTTYSAYGSEAVEGISYDYSDRLFEWHGEKYTQSWKEAEAKGFAKNSPALIEAFLQELFDDSTIQLIHLLTGFNIGNGFSYCIYGYIPGNKSE